MKRRQKPISQGRNPESAKCEVRRAKWVRRAACEGSAKCKVSPECDVRARVRSESGSVSTCGVGVRNKSGVCAVAVVVAACVAVAAQPRAGELRIYVIDVEGGSATLFVAPSGESVLIDTGNDGAAAGRDAVRIVAAVKDAGLSQIDHLITPHWHGDRFGVMAGVGARVPIKHYIDHGPTVQPQPASTEFLEKTYPGLLAAATHTVAQPGDRVPLTGIDWRIVSSGGRVLKSPLAGAGRPNPLCAAFKPQ